MPGDRNTDAAPALTNAERQANYRARRQALQPIPRLRYRRPTDRRSRPQRWNDAVAELLALQAEYAAWSDALPDRLRETPTADALQAIAELDLSDLAAIQPPRGYGRDYPKRSGEFQRPQSAEIQRALTRMRRRR